MQIKTQEHQDIISMFEREYSGRRHEKESKDLWVKGNVYQDGMLNELFLAYRKGYALGKTVAA